ncbi:MAG: hypothetical protein WC848_01620 [Parcubacteria group bacterium]
MKKKGFLMILVGLALMVLALIWEFGFEGGRSCQSMGMLSATGIVVLSVFGTILAVAGIKRW